MTISVMLLILFIVCFVFIAVVIKGINEDIAATNDAIDRLQKIIERNNK